MFLFKSSIFSSFYKRKNKFADVFSILFTNFYSKIYLLILLVLNLGNFVFVYFLKSKINSDLTVLHYNTVFGVDLIGEPTKIYYLPLTGLLISVINIILLLNIFKASKFLNHLIFFFSLLINVIIFLGIFSVYLANF